MKYVYIVMSMLVCMLHFGLEKGAKEKVWQIL